MWKYLNDKTFMQILPLIEHHYVVITNLELTTEETNTIYIFHLFFEIDNDIKISSIFHQNLLQLATENAKENQFQINEANSLPSSGYYVIMYAYTLFRNLDIFSLKVAQENISSNIISFFETN